MRLEDYFVFHSADDIRLQACGVAIEDVLHHYLYRFEAPEAIAARFPMLRVEHVYATITYYWHCQDAVSAYMARWRERRDSEQAQRSASAERPCAAPVHANSTRAA